MKERPRRRGGIYLHACAVSMFTLNTSARGFYYALVFIMCDRVYFACARGQIRETRDMRALLRQIAAAQKHNSRTQRECILIENLR